LRLAVRPAETAPKFTDEVYVLAPYSSSTVPRTPNYRDGVFVNQKGSKCMPRLSGNVKQGIEARIALGVHPQSTPALVAID
jgi:hypothetical protein